MHVQHQEGVLLTIPKDPHSHTDKKHYHSLLCLLPLQRNPHLACATYRGWLGQHGSCCNTNTRPSLLKTRTSFSNTRPSFSTNTRPSFLKTKPSFSNTRPSFSNSRPSFWFSINASKARPSVWRVPPCVLKQALGRVFR